MILDKFNVVLFEMRCDCCGSAQQVSVKSADPFLTRCTSCKSLLAVELEVKEKTNNVLFSLVVTAVPQKAEKPKTNTAADSALRVVA